MLNNLVSWPPQPRLVVVVGHSYEYFILLRLFCQGFKNEVNFSSHAEKTVCSSQRFRTLFKGVAYSSESCLAQQPFSFSCGVFFQSTFFQTNLQFSPSRSSHISITIESLRQRLIFAREIYFELKNFRGSEYRARLPELLA